MERENYEQEEKEYLERSEVEFDNWYESGGKEEYERIERSRNEST